MTSLKKTTGVLVGKFLPLHRGHETLIRFASQFCDELTVLVDHIPRELFGDTFVSEHKRMEWIQELFPDVTVKTFPKQMPQEPSEHPDFWNIWKTETRALLEHDPDYVFASEMYGFTIADLLGATYIPLDRNDVPGAVSGTMMRERFLLNWDQLASSVKKDCVYSVCVIGPESSGKSTLARELAKQYQTVCVPEYARTFLEKTTEAKQETSEVANVEFEDLDTIARGQMALANAMKPFANRLIVHDTNVLETQLWSEWFFDGKVSALVEELSRSDVQDLYLLVSPDLPWKKDSVRYQPQQDQRQQFFDRCKEVLEERGLPYVVISGKGKKRLKQAIHAIDRCLEQDFHFAYFVRRLQA